METKRMGILDYHPIGVLRIIFIVFLLAYQNLVILGEPVMSFPEGVYSLFPNEDLRTGKSTRPFQEQRLERRFQESFPRRFTDETSISGFNSRRGRILFDDDRLNIRGHFDPPSDRSVYTSGERYQERYRIIPAFGEAKLPPSRVAIAEEPTRIHVFNPESPQAPPLPRERDDSNEESFVKPGRLFIPGLRKNSFLDLREPGPDSFLNHDEFLEYQTNAAIATLQSKERTDSQERTRRPCDTESRRLLFSSPNIRGLVPPSTESQSSSTESNEPEVQSLEEEKVHVTSLLENPPRRFQIQTPVLESGGFIPIHHIRPQTNKNDEEEPELPRTIPAILIQTEAPTESTIETTTTKTTRKGRVYPYVKKSSTISTSTPAHITRIKQKNYNNENESETITFSPNTFDDFVGRRSSSAEFAATKIRTEVPLIFLESQQEFDAGSEKNAIFVKRVKNSKNFDLEKEKNSEKGNNGGESLKSKGIESTMTVHSPELSSFETLGRPPPHPLLDSDEVKLQKSLSNHGIVAKVHAHVSHCPKLHTSAEIICDVHIRKRHGVQNPQLTVGWKRKFHNTTKEDVTLAVNTTLAYIEEDFHDKFNVTLAKGVNPMLRSVLSIRHVSPSDTGNYQCEVFDGENNLRSDTLLFLCH